MVAKLAMSAVMFAAVLASAPALAQTTATPPARTPAPTAQKPADAPACGQFSLAQNAVYAAYIKLVVDELPDPRKVPDPEQMTRDLEALYARYVAAAQAGDNAAGRKATALEIFGMQMRRQPTADMTQRKLCMLAREGLRDNGLADALACAVSTLDGPRREQPGNRELARQMMDRAKAMVPANANAADVGKMLYEDVARGLAGCY